MSNVGLGDLFFIVLVLGAIHGILYSIQRLRARKSSKEPTSDD